MVVFDRDSSTEPQTWRFVKDQGHRRVVIVCPKCKQQSVLDKQHWIDQHGIVRPNLMCPYDDCGWHGAVRLRGWLTIVVDNDLPSAKTSG